jgi:hypothetical protein
MQTTSSTTEKAMTNIIKKTAVTAITILAAVSVALAATPAESTSALGGTALCPAANCNGAAVQLRDGSCGNTPLASGQGAQLKKQKGKGTGNGKGNCNGGGSGKRNGNGNGNGKRDGSCNG